MDILKAVVWILAVIIVIAFWIGVIVTFPTIVIGGLLMLVVYIIGYQFWKKLGG